MNWKQKFTAGFLSPGVLVVREPVAYLYNGVRLPKLPEWDKSKYPYAVIALWNGAYYFTAKPNPMTCNSAVGTTVFNSGYPVFVATDTGWDTSNAGYSRTVIWANHDVYFNDTLEEVGGTLHMSASDPVPVYE